MTRHRADAVVGFLLATVFLVGGALTWQAVQQQRAVDRMGSMMGTSMGTVHGTNPLWYVLGTVLVAAAVGGVYLAVRDDLTGAVTDPSSSESSPATDGVVESPSAADAGIENTSAADAGAEGPSTTDDETESPSAVAGRPSASVDGTDRPRGRVLDFLPEDERRVLEPVLDSPGITQIALRDRSDFSKSKVSQTVSDLEKRGLLYREPQGRTYRIYPGDDLQQTQN